MKFDILQFHPCGDAVNYYNKFATSEEAWNNCQRGSWMLWIAKRLNVDDRKFTLAKALCANTVRHLMKDKRSIDAIDTAIRYGNGEATKEELYIASYAAGVAAADAAEAAYAASNDDNTEDYTTYAADATTYAADAATNAADAADAVTNTVNAADAAYIADAAANAVAFAAYATGVADAAAARTQNQLQTADICKEILTDEVFKILYAIK